MINSSEKKDVRMKILAHRGYSSIYPENTMLAFRKALEFGADGIEFDVQLTQDDQVVVIHDLTTERTTGVEGKVEEMTLSELQGLNACFRKQELYPRETIPTLDMVFAAFGTKLLMNVEIKTRNPKRVGKLVDRVIETILYYKNQESIIFSSFNFGDLVKARNVFPEIKTGLIADKGPSGWGARAFFKHSIHVDAIHPHLDLVTPKFVHNEHLCNREVRPWVVNSSYDMMRFQRMGVDAIITDDPILGLVYSGV